MSGDQPTPHARWVHEATHRRGVVVTAPQPVTADELATIRARCVVGVRPDPATGLRLVAEIERLQHEVGFYKATAEMG